jgi:hypothetical protein
VACLQNGLPQITKDLIEVLGITPRFGSFITSDALDNEGVILEMVGIL